MGGNVVYRYSSDNSNSFSTNNDHSTVSDIGNIYAKEIKKGMNLDELIQKLKGILLLVMAFSS